MQVDFKKFRNRNKDFKVIERLKFEQSILDKAFKINEKEKIIKF